MNWNRLTTLILLILTFSFVQKINGQQYKSAIRGTIKDEESQMPLPGVTVVLLNTDPLKAVATDPYGNFRLENVPVGKHAIRVSFIGYETVTIPNLTVVSGKELLVNVAMIEEIDQIEAVEVIAEKPADQLNNEMSTVSARTLSMEQATRYSGSLQDPSRMAQNFAGVSGASDNRNDIIIRGNSPLGVLWRMEGVDIPSPNHFSTLGTTGGPISMLNVNNLANSDFMTSAWSADYGNALSGVFDLQMRPGNSHSREYVGQLGFNGFELGAEGPFKKGGKGSYLINGRYSTLGVMSALGWNLGVGTAVPEYRDLNFKLDLPTEKAGRFSVWGILGNSNVEFEATPEVDSTNLFNDNDQESKFKSGTIITGAKWLKFLSDKTYISWSGAYSRAQTKGTSTRVNFKTDKRTLLLELDQIQAKVSNHLKLNSKIDKKNTLSTGLILDNYFVDILDSGLARAADSIIPNDIYVVISDNQGHGLLQQGYLNWKHRFSKKVTLTSGLHEQWFQLTNNVAVEPRVGLSFQPNAQHKLSLGLGVHSQLQPIPIYFIEDSLSNFPNQQLGFSKAFHSVIAHDYKITEKLSLKTELYYQRLFGVPVENNPSFFSMLNEGADFGLPEGYNYVNEGEGYNYGAEFTLEKSLSNGFYYLLTTSIFDSRYKGSDGVERNTVFNGRYVVNGLTGKEWQLSEKVNFTLDTRLTHSGGRRFIPIDTAQSRIQMRQVRDLTSIYEEQYQPYFRWDVKIGVQWNGKKVSQKFMLDIQNITNRQNIFLVQYNSDTNELDTTYQRGFFPIILYQIFF